MAAKSQVDAADGSLNELVTATPRHLQIIPCNANGLGLADRNPMMQKTLIATVHVSTIDRRRLLQKLNLSQAIQVFA